MMGQMGLRGERRWFVCRPDPLPQESEEAATRSKLTGPTGGCAGRETGGNKRQPLELTD